MHMSHSSKRTLRQTHRELCQGQTSFFVKFGTFNMPLKVAPMNHRTRNPGGSSERDRSDDWKAVLCKPPTARGGRHEERDEGTGEGPFPCSPQHYCFPLFDNLGGVFI